MKRLNVGDQDGAAAELLFELLFARVELVSTLGTCNRLVRVVFRIGVLVDGRDRVAGHIGDGANRLAILRSS